MPENKYVTPSGSPIKNHYEGKIDKNGLISLVKTGEDNIYQKIQAESDSCDINLLIKRFQAGDEQALNRVKFFYGDVSGFPTSYNEMLNTVNGAKDTFEHLPIEIRAKFDYDFNKYFSTMDTEEWFEKMSVKKKEILEGPIDMEEKEVKTE